MRIHLVHTKGNSDMLEVVLGSSHQSMLERELTDKELSFLSHFGGTNLGSTLPSP